PAERERLLRLCEAIGQYQEDFLGQIRRAELSRDGATLGHLADGAQVERRTPAELYRLARALAAASLPEKAVPLLEAGQRRYPGDFWINEELGHLLLNGKPPRPADALTYYRIALGVRPQSPGAQLNVGCALMRLGKPAEATAAFCRAIELN